MNPFLQLLCAWLVYALAVVLKVLPTPIGSLVWSMVVVLLEAGLVLNAVREAWRDRHTVINIWSRLWMDVLASWYRICQLWEADHLLQGDQELRQGKLWTPRALLLQAWLRSTVSYGSETVLQSVFLGTAGRLESGQGRPKAVRRPGETRRDTYRRRPLSRPDSTCRRAVTGPAGELTTNLVQNRDCCPRPKSNSRQTRCVREQPEAPNDTACHLVLNLHTALTGSRTLSWDSC